MAPLAPPAPPLADRVDAPISVSVDGRSVEVDPAEAGLSFDLDASVEAAGGGSSWAASARR